MNEIPLSLYIFINTATFLLIIFTLTQEENLVRIVTSFISALLSYVNAMWAVSGNIIMIETTGSGYATIVINNTTLNYIWTFLALVMVVLFVLFMADEINERLQPVLDTEDNEGGY